MSLNEDFLMRDFSLEEKREVEALYISSLRNNPHGFIQDVNFHGNISDALFRYQNEGGFSLVLKDTRNNTIIGFGALRYIDENTAELCKLHLDKAYQGQGLGERLVKRLIEKAKEKPFKELELHVTLTQKAAIGLYKKLEFQVWKQELHTVDVFGQPVDFDTVYMKLYL